jgi:Bacterial regulatory protein, Fis family
MGLTFGGVLAGSSDLPSLDELERRYLLHVLDAVAGNRTRAAEVLGIDRSNTVPHGGEVRARSRGRLKPAPTVSFRRVEWLFVSAAIRRAAQRSG